MARTICNKCFFRYERNKCVLGKVCDELNRCDHFQEVAMRSAFRVKLVDEYGLQDSRIAFDMKELLTLVEANAVAYDIDIRLTRLCVAEKDV